jgi:hypothetical protein
MDTEGIEFHIAHNDYFGTLATVLDLTGQAFEQRGVKESDGTKVREKKWFAARLFATALGLNRHKHSLDLLQRLRIIRSYNPPLFRHIVFVENAQVQRVFPIRAEASPSLESAAIFQSRSLVKIISIENQRFALCEENTAARFLHFARAGHVIHLSNIKVPRAHEFPDVSVMVEQRLQLPNSPVSVSQQGRHFC